MRNGKTVKRQGKYNRFAWIQLTIIAVILTLLIIPSDFLFGCPGNDPESDPDPNTPKKSSNVPYTPTSGDPIQVFDGAVLETAVDLEIPGISGAWTHSRTYISKYHDSTFIQGMGWRVDGMNSFLYQDETGGDVVGVHEIGTQMTQYDTTETYPAAHGNLSHQSGSDSYIYYSTRRWGEGGYNDAKLMKKYDLYRSYLKNAYTVTIGNKIIHLSSINFNDGKKRSSGSSHRNNLETSSDSSAGSVGYADGPPHNKAPSKPIEEFHLRNEEEYNKGFQEFKQLYVSGKLPKLFLKLAGMSPFKEYHDGTQTVEHKRGVMKAEADVYENKIDYDYNTEEVRITNAITTQGWKVVYTYGNGAAGAPEGMLIMVEVKKPIGGSQYQVLQRARYSYYKSTYSDDVGTDGDLVMVKVFKRGTKDNLSYSDDNHFSIQRTTMYRYYQKDDSSGSGTEHQIKMVFEPEAVAAMKAAGTGKTEEEILAMADDGIVHDSVAVQDYANRTYTYHTVNSSTTNVIGGVGGDNENLQSKYSAFPFDETGYVRSQTIRKDYSGYIGTRVFFYMCKINQEDDTREVTNIVVEDTITDAQADTGTRTIYGINKDGQHIRNIFVDNPQADTPKYWCTSKILGQSTNDINQFIEERSASAHTCVDTPDEVNKFLDPQGGTTAGQNDIDTLNESSGVIVIKEYDTEGMLVFTGVRNGSAGDTYWTSGTEYGDGTIVPQNLVAKEITYPEKTIFQADATRLETSYSYEFHDANKTQIKIKTTTFEPVSGDKNGSDVESTEKEYLDKKGRVRWKKNAGRVTYYSYNPNTGGVAYTMVDVDTGHLSAEIAGTGGGKWLAWTEDVPTGFECEDENALQLVTKTEYDDQGRIVKTIDPMGTITCTAYGTNTKRVYRCWNDTNHTTTLPIAVEKTNDDDLTTETYTVDPGEITIALDANNYPTGADTNESPEDYFSWTRYVYNEETALLEKVEQYHNIPNNQGVLGTNYYRTVYKYDSVGRKSHMIRVVSGTSPDTDGVEQVVQIVRDALGRPIAVKKGVSGSGQHMGSSYDTSGVTLKEVITASYDSGGVGDGLITSTKRYYDASNPNNFVETIYHYDWRGELRGVQPPAAPYVVQDVDNMGRITAVALFSSQPASWTTVVETDDYAGNTTTGRTGRSALVKEYYDELGQKYLSERYRVNSNGEAGLKIRLDRYYDRLGQLVGITTPRGGAVEYAYDAVGRKTESRMVTALKGTYTSGVFNYCQPEPGSNSGGDDGVLQLTRLDYDKAGNVVGAHSLEANHNDTGTNEIGLNLSSNDDYIQTTAFAWYDDAYRITAIANYGTYDNEGRWIYVTAPSQPPTAPPSSDTVLVSTFTYEDGRLASVTDPKGNTTAFTYDDLGRTIQTIEADGQDEERWTLTEYNGASAVIRAIADPNKYGEFSNGVWSTDSDSQVTNYTYSDEYDIRQLTKIQYPDSVSADWDVVSMDYWLDGKIKTRTAPKAQQGDTATEITFDYDNLRRLEKQRVTDIDTGIVDNSVQSMKYTYNTKGQIEKVTSYSDNNTTTAVNEVMYTYDDMGMLTTESQEHDGVVSSSPCVQYVYGIKTPMGYLNVLRLDTVTYPNGRVIHYVYDGHGGIDDDISRANKIAEDDGYGDVGATIVEYLFTAGGRIARKDYATPDVRLDYWGGQNSTYAGFDQFGRIAQQHWVDYESDPDKDLFKIGHGYDRASNRLYADRQIYGGYSQLYQYDHLHRLTDFESGILNEDKDDVPYWPFRNQAWTLDSVGNQTAVNDHGEEPWSSGTFNKANEYKNESGSLQIEGAYSITNRFSGWTQGAYNYESPGGPSDTFSVGNNGLTFTGVSQDAFEDESKCIVYLGDNIGPVKSPYAFFTFPNFANPTDKHFSGYVFGYKSELDYWMFVVEVVGTPENRECVGRLYHVMDRSIPKDGIAERGPYLVQTDTIPWQDSRLWTLSFSQRKNKMMLQFGYLFGPTKTAVYQFDDGIPTGKMGAVTNVIPDEYDNCAKTSYGYYTDSAIPNNLQGRWYGDRAGGSYVRYNGGLLGYHLYSTEGESGFVLHRGVRLKEFQATFSVINGGFTPNVAMLAFNAKGFDNLDYIRIPLKDSSPEAPSAYSIVDGNITTSIAGTPHPENMPTVSFTERLWIRVTYEKDEYDNYNLHVKCSKDTTPNWGSISDCLTISDFDIDGGMIGLGGQVSLTKKITVESKVDSSWVTESVDDFETPASTSLNITPTYDAAGNLTFDGLFVYKYDAWNRLTTVTRAYPDPTDLSEHIEGSVVATMEYDGLGRRIVKTITNSGDWNCTYNYYYNGQQMVEVRNGSDKVLKQYVWGLQYVDELCQIGHNDNPADAGENNCDSFYWTLQDANFNVLGLVGDDGNLKERYEYTPYGRRTVYTTAGTNDPMAMCPLLDSGGVTTENPMGLCDVGHQGLLHDREFGLIYNRMRYFSPTLGRFTSRDPLMYIDGMSMYEYEGSKPITHRDPFGLYDPYDPFGPNGDLNPVNNPVAGLFIPGPHILPTIHVNKQPFIRWIKDRYPFQSECEETIKALKEVQDFIDIYYDTLGNDYPWSEVVKAMEAGPDMYKIVKEQTRKNKELNEMCEEVESDAKGITRKKEPQPQEPEPTTKKPPTIGSD